MMCAQKFDRPVSILHVIVDLNIGGAETALMRLIAADPARVADTVVVSLTTAGPIGEKLRSHGVMLHELGMVSALSAPVALWRLVRLIRHYRPQVIQTWMYHADLIGGLAAHLARNGNLVWGIRRSDVSIRSLRGTWLIMKASALLSKFLPKRIVCVAEAAMNTHIRAGYDSTRMVVIPNGFDFERLTATPAQRAALRVTCGFLETDTVIGIVGRFERDKGQDICVKAAAIVARHSKNVRWLMVGRGCDSQNIQLNTWLRQFGLQDHFVLLGERSDVPVCLAAMDIFCLSSRAEGFPNALGEAMAMGLPCVATEVGDVKLLVGDTAVLVPPENTEAMGGALLNVLNLSAEQRSQMGQTAKARVLSEYSIKKTASRFNAVYQQVISEGDA